MTIQGFDNFSRDYQIYPDILPESTVKGLFNALSDFYNQGRPGPRVIDEHLFVETLALSALEMKFQDPQPSQIEKVIVLLDCMNNARDDLDLLDQVKAKYPGLFQDSD